MPPFVLVHGAFHGAWCWTPIARLLRARGHEVFAPTLTGLGERRHLLSKAITIETFVLDVLNVLEFEALEDVILVGHSFGARPACGVADRAPGRIRQIIFLDGALSPDGLSKLEAMPPDARAARIQSSMDFDGGISIPVPPPRYFGISDPAAAAWISQRLTPQPLGAEQTGLKLNHPIGNGRPVTYVKCTNPPHPSVASGADYAKTRSDWRYLELDTGHNCIVTDPERVADLLLREAALRDG
jgi:pimeloyl-ACP methyl ester carboxylesterase